MHLGLSWGREAAKKWGCPSPRCRQEGGWRGLLEPCGFLLLRPAPENNQERKRREKTRQGKKKSKGGAERLALIAAELRRDALIAPRGCGQRRGEEEKVGGEVWGGEYSARRAGLALCQMSSLAPMLLRPHGIYDIHTSGDRCIYSRGSTAGSSPGETQPPPHGGTQKRQEAAVRKLSSVGVLPEYEDTVQD